MDFEGVPVDLADGAPVGADLRLEAGGQGYLGEAFEDLFAVPVVGALVVEDHGDAGEAGKRGGAEVRHVGDAGEADLERDGDLLLDLFGGAAGPLGDDGDVVVGDVGVGLHGEVVEGDAAPDKEEDGDDHDDEAAVEGKVYDLRDHAAVLMRRGRREAVERATAKAKYRGPSPSSG